MKLTNKGKQRFIKIKVIEDILGMFLYKATDSSSESDGDIDDHRFTNINQEM